MDLQIFTAGGTIDKLYFDQASEYEVGEPQIGELLREAGVTIDCQIETVLRKDSLEMTDADRQTLVEHVVATPASDVLITHGTDTMALSARALEEALGPKIDKTVVLVGALQPARFKSSDAAFNIGFAMAAVQFLSAGVYIAMNGQVFEANEVRKNRAANRFERAAPGRKRD